MYDDYEHDDSWIDMALEDKLMGYGPYGDPTPDPYDYEWEWEDDDWEEED